MFENRKLTRIFGRRGARGHKVMVGWRKLHNVELQKSYLDLSNQAG
jgi:hypothetical protein